MKRRKHLYIAQVPPVSHEFAQELARRFPPLEIKPGVTQDDMMYNSGERHVVDFVLRSATGMIISGNIDDLKKEKHNVSLLDKLLGNLKK